MEDTLVKVKLVQFSTLSQKNFRTEKKTIRLVDRKLKALIF